MSISLHDQPPLFDVYMHFLRTHSPSQIPFTSASLIVLQCHCVETVQVRCLLVSGGGYPLRWCCHLHDLAIYEIVKPLIIVKAAFVLVSLLLGGNSEQIPHLNKSPWQNKQLTPLHNLNYPGCFWQEVWLQQHQDMIVTAWNCHIPDFPPSYMTSSLESVVGGFSVEGRICLLSMSLLTTKK